MNILIVGGRDTTEYLLKSLSNKSHNITFIHDDYDYCKNISRKYDVTVICGDGSKPYILEEAKINKNNVVIAMTSSDSDNLVICQLAKKVYGIKKAFATVCNPKNVEVFKKLGIDTAISATYVVAEMIEQVTTVNEIYNFMPIEDGSISIIEVVVKEKYHISNKLLKDIEFSQDAIIGCIIRGKQSIIPNGNTKILPHDKLIILSPPNLQNTILNNVVRGA